MGLRTNISKKVMVNVSSTAKLTVKVGNERLKIVDQHVYLGLIPSFAKNDLLIQYMETKCVQKESIASIGACYAWYQTYRAIFELQNPKRTKSQGHRISDNS